MLHFLFNFTCRLERRKGYIFSTLKVYHLSILFTLPLLTHQLVMVLHLFLSLFLEIALKKGHPQIPECPKESHYFHQQPSCHYQAKSKFQSLIQKTFTKRLSYSFREADYMCTISRSSQTNEKISVYVENFNKL